MAKGWISIHRKIQDCEIWTDAEPFDRRSAWVDLLLMANHEDKHILINGEPQTIKKGQRLTSTIKLAERWKWSINRVRRYLALLERLDMVITDRTTNGTIITIVNYGFYQGGGITNETTNETTNGTTDGTTDGIQTIMKNNENKLNNNRGHFTPPSLDDVRAYCQERKNGVDPQTFIDFYESKGWFVGKNKMKDWKAAVRTWEKRRIDHKASTGMQTNNYDFSDLEKRLLGG